MSRWAHIRGGMELVSNPHEFKGESPDYHYGSKDAYLPYPEEQLKISAPTAHVFTKNKKGEKDVKLKFRAYLYSLPRAKKYIKEAFDLLPQGEVGWSYSMNQTIHNGSIVWNGYSVLGIKGATLDPVYDECLVIQEPGNPIDFSIVKNDTWKAVRANLKK